MLSYLTVNDSLPCGRSTYLEGVLKQYRPELANDHLLQHEPSRPQSQPTSSKIPQPTENEDKHGGLDQLASKVGLLSLNAAGAEPHYLGSSSTFAFSRLINSSLRQVVLNNTNNDRTHGQNQDDATTLPSPCLLPDPDTAVKLSDAYFQNIHTQYPFLHEPTFRAWEAMIVTGSAEFETLISNPLPLFFLNMVYAVGALMLSNCGFSGERLYISAQMYIDHILPRENLEAIQAILCCAVYSLRSSIGTSHWKLDGLALRQCIDLGYHRTSKRFGSTTDPLRLELRKRVFWCAYVMETQAAVMLGRPQCIPYQDVDAEYPMDVNDLSITDIGIYDTLRGSPGDPPTNMTGAIHTFKIRRILSRIHSSLYSNVPCCSSAEHMHEKHVQHLRAEIESWRAEIPSTTPCTGQALSLFATPDWFDMEYDYTILHLYRSQIIDRQSATADSVFLDCLRAAERICHSYRRQYLGKPTSYTWAALHELFLAGLTYLHCLWTSPAAREIYRQGQVSSTCTDCTIVLVLMAERWDTAAPYRDIFETLANRTLTMMDDRAEGRPAAPSVSAVQGNRNEGELMQWMTDIADEGMPEGFNGLLTSLVSDFLS
ncbi:putative transcriptional activator protein acu-15 [Dactylonectria macrodidyma]|uniref:Transcriptional activator protein acu-15 n=1 Tax=Dactylonectria macrodidyma TaxID=307937 RepID=A0A9P9FVM2_9HYPO|nr:putative transcriptional activator protein acu-15 [Dactylonectria macrodidyma]